MSTKWYNWPHQATVPVNREELWTELDMETLTANVEKHNETVDYVDQACWDNKQAIQIAQTTASTALSLVTAARVPFQQGILTGNLDGINTTFTTSPVPTSGVMLFKNGLLQHNSSTDDYVLNGATITFAADNIPQPTDKIVVYVY